MSYSLSGLLTIPAGLHVTAERIDLNCPRTSGTYVGTYSWINGQEMLMSLRCFAMQVFMLSADAVVDEGLLLSILESGHSRVPVHKPGSR